MSIEQLGLKNYASAMAEFTDAQKHFERINSAAAAPAKPETSFAETLHNSLETVNDLQGTKNKMIQSFASGETQNVHELMISLQKAGLAVNMTSAVRNKVLEAYKELTNLQF